MPILYFLCLCLLTTQAFAQNIPQISGSYSGYAKIYNTEHQHFEHYSIQMKIYQKNSVIIASVMDRVLGTKNFAITELHGTIKKDILYLNAIQFKQKENDAFYDFILTDYRLFLNKYDQNILYGVLSSFYLNRNNIIASPYDSVFLERKNTTVSLDNLYEYTIPQKNINTKEETIQLKKHKELLDKVDDIFFHKKPHPKHNTKKK